MVSLLPLVSLLPSSGCGNVHRVLSHRQGLTKNSPSCRTPKSWGFSSPSRERGSSHSVSMSTPMSIRRKVSRTRRANENDDDERSYSYLLSYAPPTTRASVSESPGSLQTRFERRVRPLLFGSCGGGGGGGAGSLDALPLLLLWLLPSQWTVPSLLGWGRVCLWTKAPGCVTCTTPPVSGSTLTLYRMCVGQTSEYQTASTRVGSNRGNRGNRGNSSGSAIRDVDVPTIILRVVL
mmetsp:Transcript_3518/g.7691  ORF Transcript_3518/g.7691 Transcript_3518/m.7691 type:complete len:235 (-) Transcript_3518:181-885(-)